MLAYILKRIVLMLPTLLGVLLLTFVVIQFVPGGPVEQYLAEAKAGAGGGVVRSALVGGKRDRGREGFGHGVTVSLDVAHVAAHQGQLDRDAGQQQADENKGKGVHGGSGGEDGKGRRVLKQALHRVVCRLPGVLSAGTG